jgi:hypothetical protein
MIDIPAGSGVPGAPYVLVFGGDGSNAVWALSGEVADTESLSCPYVFPLREFHGAMMFLSWGFLLPIGVMMARYGRQLIFHRHWYWSV